MVSYMLIRGLNSRPACGACLLKLLLSCAKNDPNLTRRVKWKIIKVIISHYIHRVTGNVDWYILSFTECCWRLIGSCHERIQMSQFSFQIGQKINWTIQLVMWNTDASQYIQSRRSELLLPLSRHNTAAEP